MTTQAELAAATTGRDLVPGDPGRLHEVAGLLQAYAEDLGGTARAFATLSPSSWTGQAADRFRAAFAPAPGRWQGAADAFAQASRAVSTYATSLLLAQDDADRALARFRRGTDAMSTDAVTGGRGGLGATTGADDPGAHDRALAVVAVDDARERVRTAGVAAHNAVRAATAAAPENPAWWASTAAALRTLGAAAAEATWNDVLVPAVNGVATFGNAMGLDPLGTLGMVGGALLVVGGGALDAGGAAICVTGVGCAATPAVEAAGTGMIVTGVSTFGAGALSVGTTAAANPITVVERTGTPGSGGAKPATPGRTFNVERTQSPVWRATKPWRGKTRTNGLSGKDKRYYEWDRTHHDIEVYDKGGNHLGTLDPITGARIKPPEPGRQMDK